MKSIMGAVCNMCMVREPSFDPQKSNRHYPRIIGADGVWVNEIRDFDIAYVESGPGTFGALPMEEAKRICVADERQGHNKSR